MPTTVGAATHGELRDHQVAGDESGRLREHQRVGARSPVSRRRRLGWRSPGRSRTGGEASRRRGRARGTSGRRSRATDQRAPSGVTSLPSSSRIRTGSMYATSDMSRPSRMKPTAPSSPTLGVRLRLFSCQRQVFRTLPFDHRQELLGLRRRHRDGLPAVRGAARDAVCAALEAAGAGIGRAEADRDGAAVEGVAALVELDDRVRVGLACQRRRGDRLAERLLQELDLWRFALQRGACKQCGAEERCENGDDHGPHWESPGVCRAIRSPQIFVGRHSLGYRFRSRAQRESACIQAIDWR